MSRRTSISVHDYPEHLNPFSELHNQQLQYEPEPYKFHTVGRPKKRRSSISNAWNLFASRKTKPVEASLNLSPRLPRSTSLANNELREPVPPARRKLFSDLSWLPGRRRFTTSSQQSSPNAVHRNPDDHTMERHRSISLSRTSENTVYQHGETPLFTLRTHRYRSPSLSPSEDRTYKTSSLQPVKYGDENYPGEQRDRSSSERLYIEEPPPRTRSSSLSPTMNGGLYGKELRVEQSSPQGLERLYIEEPGDRSKLSLTLNRTENGDKKYSERLYIEESIHSVPSPQSHSLNDEKLSPAVTPSHERPSPYDEPLVPQRPPRPPRTKKRRAPLPPLPRFAQKPSPTELPATESSEQRNSSEDETKVTENQTNSSEEQPVASCHQIEIAETQLIVAEEQMKSSELQSNIVEEQMNISEQQKQIVEEQTNISEQLTNVAELQKSISELQTDISEQQHHAHGEDSDTKEKPDLESGHTTVEIHETNLDNSEKNDGIPDKIMDMEEIQKPQTKIRTKFGNDILI